MAYKDKSPQWSKKTEEMVGWYVYALRDPRTGTVFYIGKGKESRAFQHAKSALEGGDKVTPKSELIREIQKETGTDPEILIIRHQLASEKAAYEIEAALLDFTGLLGVIETDHDTPVALTNVMGGQHSSSVGLMNHEAIEALYAAKPLDREDFELPAIAFRISRLWTPLMSSAELFEATHGWWTVGPRREGALYALSISRGVIRVIFSIEQKSWRVRREGDRGWVMGERPRWGFDGHDVSDSLQDFVNRDVSSWFGKSQQTPFTYINC